MEIFPPNKNQVKPKGSIFGVTFCEKHLKLLHSSNPTQKRGEKQMFSPHSQAEAVEKSPQVSAVQGFTRGPYIIIQGLVIQLLQLCLVIPELDPVQHLCQQQNQGIFVPAATRETHKEVDKTLPAQEI